MILCAGYLVFTKPRYLAPMLLHLATMHFMYVYDYRPNHCIMESDAHRWDTQGHEAGCVMSIHTGSTTRVHASLRNSETFSSSKHSKRGITESIADSMHFIALVS